MFIRIRTLLTSMLLLCVLSIDAQLQRRQLPAFPENLKSETDDVNEDWWGYFDGDYNSISVTGIGATDNLPQIYNCAIKIEAGNPEVLGKRIKAFTFAFERIDYIDDVKVWMSNTMPENAEDADICCISLDKASLKSFEKDNDVNEVAFPEPYQVRNEDVYIGYSFNVTSNEGDLCVFPIVVSYSSTMQNAFFLNWGAGWYDMAGKNYGNLAVMLLLDDGGEYLMGDTNYDLDINVIDVTTIIEYILNGDIKPFNAKSADIDGNGTINIVDVESLIDIILERYQAPADKVAADSDDALVAELTDDGLSLSLNAVNSYRGFQMDVVVPEGCEITSVNAGEMMSSTHDIRFKEIAAGRYRIMANSINGNDIADNLDRLLDISADTDDIKIENIIFVSSKLQEKCFDNIYLSDVNGIDNVNTERKSSDIYNIYGMKVNGSTDNLVKGVYVADGKKIIIK